MYKAPPSDEVRLLIIHMQGNLWAALTITVHIWHMIIYNTEFVLFLFRHAPHFFRNITLGTATFS